VEEPLPAVSKKQRRFFGWAEHNPSEAKAEGKYPKEMTHKQMHDFAATKEKGLPARKRKFSHAHRGKK
jgi:hypothetical protein